MPISLYLVDDHAMVRDGLRALFSGDDYVISGEAEDGLCAFEEIERLQPDVAIVDINLPSLNGIAHATALRQRQCPTRVIALSMQADRAHIVDMLRAGAMGYVLKSSAFAELETAVRQVMLGQRYFSQGLTAMVMDLLLHGPAPREPDGEPLSPRQLLIVRLIAENCSSQAIAERLGLSVRTVEWHRARILEKLGLTSAVELTKYAIRAGLVSLESK